MQSSENALAADLADCVLLGRPYFRGWPGRNSNDVEKSMLSNEKTASLLWRDEYCVSLMSLEVGAAGGRPGVAAAVPYMRW